MNRLRISCVCILLALLVGSPSVSAQSARPQDFGITAGSEQDQWAAMKARQKPSHARLMNEGQLTPLRPTPNTSLAEAKPFALERRKAARVPRVAADYKMPTQIYGFWANASQSDYGLYTFTADAPNTIKPVLRSEAYQANGGGIYANGKLHFITYVGLGYFVWSYQYFQFDTYDWSRTAYVAGTSTALRVADGDYDPATGRIYAMLFNETLSANIFSTVDYENNSYTAIREYSTDEAFCAMAISPAGVVYAIGFDGNLYQIDKTSGRATLVGATGVSPSYMQSCAIDPRTGKMFWAACTADNTSGLYEVNLETGQATLVAEFDGLKEFTTLFIPAPRAEEDAPAAPTQITASFTRDALEGTLRFHMPKLTYAGETLTDETLTYRVYANDELLAEGTSEPNANVSVQLTLPERNMYRFKACAVNSAGEGDYIRLDKFIGNDEPTAPRSVKLARAAGENAIRLTWAAPSGGVHSGYVAASSLNYTVVRQPDGAVVAQNTSERAFTETLSPEALTNYYYVVTAYNGEIEGQSAESNRLALGECAEIPYYEDFEDQTVVGSMFTIIDANNDGATWMAGNWNSGVKDVYYQYNDQNRTIGANDWIITPAIHLQAGHFYNVSFSANCSLYGNEKISVSYGKEKTVAAMTTEVVPETEVTSMNPQTFSGLVMTTEEGLYYFGFHATSDPDMGILDLDDIAITEGGVFTAPGLVTDFTVTPAPNGALNAGIEFNAPTTDFNGDPISQIDSIVVYRGTLKRRVFTDVTPGQNFYMNDTQVPNGSNTYYVYTYNQYGCGIPAQQKAWIGTDIPDEPTDLTLTLSGKQARLKWNAPTTGQHGGYIKPSSLTYNIEDSYAYIKGTNRAGTTYSETITKTEQDFLYYRVSAQSSAGGGNYAYSNTVISGEAYKLPFTESFANAASSKLWSQQASGGEIGLTNSIAADGDKGAALFKPAKMGDVGMITSGKINVATAQHPVLEFYYYALPRHTQTLSVGIAPNGDADNLQLAHTINYATLSGQAGWRKATVKLDSYTSTDYILISFIGRATGTSFDDIAFDAITVRDQYDADLSVSLDMPAYAIVGQPLKAVATVENVGRLAQTNYKVQLLKNGIFADEQPGVNVEPQATVSFPFEVPTLVTDQEENTFAVSIVFADDADNSNNTAETNVAYEMPTFPVPTPTGAANVGDELTLNWKAPDLSPRNIEVSDNFDRYQPFTISGFGRWSTLDQDAAGTGVLQSSDGSYITYDHAGMPFAFQVFNPAWLGISGSQLATHSGDQMLINMMEPSTKANDWLISPELTGHEQTISFWVRSVAADYIESFEVMASSTGNSPTDFTVIESSATSAPVEWTLVTATLPEGTKYFAVHVATQQKFMLMIDDFTYTLYNTADLKLLGYNLYWSGIRINEQPITLAGYQGDWYGDGDYQVSAVYEQGESMLSEPFVIGTDGIATIEPSSRTQPDAIYNLAGQRVGKARKGVYVVNGRKVVVK